MATTSDFQINGPARVDVKGPQGSLIQSIVELGLSDGDINVSFEVFQDDLKVDAAGEAPVDVAFRNAIANISMNLVFVTRTVLDECIRLMMLSTAVGRVGAAGARYGGGLARFAAGNALIGLNIRAPFNGKPHRFYYAHLAGSPVQISLGTRRSAFACNWRAIPYTADPYGDGAGTLGNFLYDHTLDT